MARENVPLWAFNRGLVSPKALARTDLDRTRLSAAVMTNWIPSTQGAMRIRPGTKYLGSSFSDTGAAWIEFVAATDDTALLEFTDRKMRVWIDDALLGRPAVATTLSITDTGWTDASTGTGSINDSGAIDIIPVMTGPTTDGVTITASSQNSTANGTTGGAAWQAADDWAVDGATAWQDTGFAPSDSAVPSWLNVDFGAGSTQTVLSYALQHQNLALSQLGMPSAWRLLGAQFDTGTFATDTGKWALEDSQSGQTGWAIGEKRTFTLSDTGTADAWRHWRLYVTANEDGRAVFLHNYELYGTGGSTQSFAFNANSIGSLAKATRRVIVDTGDQNVEHSLAIRVERGPVTLRVGSVAGDDNYIAETSIGTGYHNLAFTPVGNFHITMQSDAIVDRIVQSVDIGDTGTVELTTPWVATDLDNMRETQSADVVYVDCVGVKPHKIERRGTGRSWSVVEYRPELGPFLPARTSNAKLRVNQTYGNATMRSDIPFFAANQVGTLFNALRDGQSGVWFLGAKDAMTDAIEVTGINDTGEIAANRERYISVAVTGTWSGTFMVQRSFDGEDRGFRDTKSTDTGTRTFTIQDNDDNVTVWYRVKLTSYTSGAAKVTVTYKGGGKIGVARVLSFNSNQNVAVEVIRRFADTGPSDNWQEGAWSDAQGYPTAVEFHEGRLAHAARANVYMSVSDDYENFDQDVEGEAGPIIRTLGAGPVDNIYYLASLSRLIAGTAGAEIAIRSSSSDEALTPENSTAKAFSTQGSANLRARVIDSRAFFVQRSRQRVFAIGFGSSIESVGDYESRELTLLVPDLLVDDVVSVAVQRQPDTRLHFVLSSGKVALLTYEAQEEVLAWSMWETDGTVERAMVLPGENEDQVYYHVNRTIGGATKRYLERWAMESESIGDTGLSWIADCAVSYTDTGRATDIQGFDHLIGKGLVAWSNDTGQTTAGKDLSPDTGSGPNGSQTLYTVDTGGNITLTQAQHHVVAGLPFTADWKSTKLAYAAQAGTALAQRKRVDEIAFIMHQTHNNGLFFGRDTGNLDPLPRVDRGAVVDADHIYPDYDRIAVSFPGDHDTDARVHLRAKAPRPATVMAAVISVSTHERP